MKCDRPREDVYRVVGSLARARSRLGLAAVLLMLVSASGCAGLETSEAEQALDTDYTDASGTLTVRIKQCEWSPKLGHPTASCTVDSDFVLVGGGAEVEGSASPGALLWQSAPDLKITTTTWLAASKDHVIAYPHRVRAYAIGLKIAGVLATTLQQAVTIVPVRSSPAHHPSATASVPAGYALVGGGATANWSGQGLLLTSSYPSGSSWIADAKDHVGQEIGTVTSYAIGISLSMIAGFGAVSNQYGYSVQTGYGFPVVAGPGGRVVTSVGGLAQYNGQGRLLTALVPISGTSGMSVSKDHVSADSGFTTAYVISLGR